MRRGSSLMFGGDITVVAGGSGYFVTSTNGVSWNSVTALGSFSSNGIAYSLSLNTIVDAGVASGTLKYSLDKGVTWSPATNPTGYDLYDVCWSSSLGMFAAVGFSDTAITGKATVLTSTNGTSWTSRIPSSISGSLQAVCWASGLKLFIAIGSVNPFGGISLVTSPDGVTWTVRTANGMSTTSSGTGVVYSSSLALVVAVSDIGRVYTSTTGIGSYTQRFASAGSRFRGIEWSPTLGLFVVVGDGGEIFTSPDATNWTSRTSGVSSALLGVKWSSRLNMFIAVGDLGVILTSPDGVTWTPQTNPAGSLKTVLALA